MTKSLKPMAIAAVFLFGCVAGGASSHFFVPPATAQQAAVATRWEYFCFQSDRDTAQAKLNGAGSEGWELATVGSFMSSGSEYCMKRPLR